MSEQMTPEEVLNSVVKGINNGDLDSLMKLYEPDACFASEPGQLAKSPESVRQCLSGFIDLKGKLDLKVKRVLQTSDLALVTTEWSYKGTGPDGNPVNIAAKSADVLRQQADGKWKFVIDNPWGTDQEGNQIRINDNADGDGDKITYQSSKTFTCYKTVLPN